MIFRKPAIPGVDGDLLVRDATRRLDAPSRRAFLRGTGSLGSLVMLTGCSVTDGAGAENLLKAVSRFNDRVQAWMFDPKRLARTFPESAIARPFPFNAFYAREDAPEIDAEDWQLEIGGRVSDRTPWTLARLASLPQETQITEHICIEGWSAVGKWTGPRLATLLQRIGADLTARYVGFRCADRYSTSLDMPSALHPQTQITLGFDGGALPRDYGYPMKVRVPTKLGFKNPKHVVELFVTNDYPGGFWEDRGYNWFAGL
jgi:DMSO/TMAO reductase YedYZ molybdopterin-dependent catalytic subunit